MMLKEKCLLFTANIGLRKSALVKKHGIGMRVDGRCTDLVH